jgi:tyrosine-protein phosphatase 2/3
MDFFSLPHQKQPAVTEDEDGATDLFAKAIDERFNNGVLASTSTSSASLNNNRITPLSLSLSPTSRPHHVPSPHISSRSHSHHLPASSPAASLFNTVLPADLPEILSEPHTLILDIRSLPAYLASRLPHAVPLSVPSTLLKRPMFSTLKLAEMLPNKAARRKFSQWHLARRILVYDGDSTILVEHGNVLGLLRKFRAEAGLPANPQPSGAAAGSSDELQLCWLKGGFQAVLRERQSLLDFNVATDDDEEGTPSPPAFPEIDYLSNSEPSDPTCIAPRQMTLSLPSGNHPTLLRTKHLPLSAFTVSSTTSQHSGSTHRKLYRGQHAAARDLVSANPSAAGPVPVRTEFVSRPSLSGAAPIPQFTSDPGPNLAFNPFYDTVRQNFELPHGITERIPLRISRIAKDRIDDLPFTWLRELGQLAVADDEVSDGEDHVEGGSSGSGSGISGGEHSGMSSDSDEDSGSGNEHEFKHLTCAMGSTNAPANGAASTPEGAQAEGSEALAMQFYRIELGEQRRLMGVMEHHSRESGRVIEEGETKSSKSRVKRSKQRSKGTGRSSRGKHGSRDFPYSITAGVEKGSKNR